MTPPETPLWAALMDGARMLHVVEPDEHLVKRIDGAWVCTRPAHEGQACRVELAA